MVVAAAAFGWFVLGGTLVVRTEQSDAAQRAALGGLWGSALEQTQPTFVVVPQQRKAPRPPDLVPSASRIGVDLALDLRRKGLLWYNTYAVAFTGTYEVTNPNPRTGVRLWFALPSNGATYDDVSVTVDGKRVPASSSDGVLTAVIPAATGRAAKIAVGYRSRGLDRKSTRLNSSHANISYAVFCLKKKKKQH